LDIEDSIRRGVGIIRTNEDYRFTPVTLDDYFPKTVIKNIEEFKDKIITEATTSARQYLPTML